MTMHIADAPALSTFVFSLQARGQWSPFVRIETSSTFLRADPGAVFGWQVIDVMTLSTWHWTCGSDPTETIGTIADYLSTCEPSATVRNIELDAAVGSTHVDDVEVGPSGTTVVYDMEPPTLKINNVKRREGDGGTVTVRFTVTPSGQNDDAMKVPFATSNGTAKAGHDYVAKSKTVTIGPGEFYVKFRITIIGDTLREGDERFKVELGTAKNAVAADGKGICTIRDDD